MLTTLSIVICLALFTKLAFFHDYERCNSCLAYRFVLFLTVVYVGHRIVGVVYGLVQPSVGMVVFHLLMLIAAFVLKPHHLPWNDR